MQIIQIIQICFSFDPTNITGLSKLQVCLREVKNWLFQNLFQLNFNKSEVIIMGSVSLVLVSLILSHSGALS